MRRKIVAGNWKMNKTEEDAGTLAAAIRKGLEGFTSGDAVLCPPFTALKTVGDAIRGSRIELGGQNMHWEKDGAYTGEVSSGMLKSLGCRYVILGHSERRIYFHETDDAVNRKAKVALASGLTPIVCVGETLAQREGGLTETVVRAQVEQSLAGFGKDLPKLVIAYEPVWAIGTGRTASPQQAQDVHAFIRRVLEGMAGREVAQAVRIQYGGSVKASNARELFGQPDIDGGLIGGAALEAGSFVEIVKAVV